MKVVFVSNYINHHQIPFCNAMREQLSEDFFFVPALRNWQRQKQIP